MPLVDSLLTAVVRSDGDALVLHVGEKPYVVAAAGPVELSRQGLGLGAMEGMLAQLLSADALRALREMGAVEHELEERPASSGDRFTVVAARGGDDIWIELRRHRRVAAPVAVASPEPTPVPSVAPAPAVPAVAAAPAAPESSAPVVPAALEVPAVATAPVDPAPAPADEPLAPAVAAAVPSEPEPQVASAPPAAAPVPEPIEVVAASVAAPATPAPAPAVVAVASSPEPEPQGESQPEPLTDTPFEPAAVMAAPPASSGTPDETSPELAALAAAADDVPMVTPALGMSLDVPVLAVVDTAADAMPAEPPPAEVAAEAADPAPVEAPVPVVVAAAPPVVVDTVSPAAVEPTPPATVPPAAIAPAPPVVEAVAADSAAPVVDHVPAAAPVPQPPVPAPLPAVATVAPVAQAPSPVAEPLPPVRPAAAAVPDVAPAPVSRPEPVPAPVAAWPMAARIESPEPSYVPESHPMLPGLASELDAMERDAEASLATPDQLPAVVLSLTRDGARGTGGSGRGAVRPGGIERLLRLASARGASALYLTTQARPAVRVDGDIRLLDGEPALSSGDVEAAVLELAPEGARDKESAEWIRDLQDVGRVRITTFRDYRGPGALLRMIQAKATSAEQLGLVREIQALATEPEGLVIVTGPRASGKSTLVSAFVDLINRQRSDYVITLEGQIRLVHESRGSLISQRELRGNAQEVVSAARAALRENPDVLVIEDLRSPDVLQVALDAAGSGLLVFASVTAASATAALERLVDLCPSDQRRNVRAALAEHLRGVVAQVLLRKAGGGRLAARELVLNTNAVAALVSDGQIAQLPRAIDSGRKLGMAPLNDALVAFVQSGAVDVREAYRKADDKAGLLALLRREGIDTSFVERLA